MKPRYTNAFPLRSAIVRARGVCHDCQGRFDPKDLDAHHIRPARLGGPDTFSNLVALCASCHARREARLRALRHSISGRNPATLSGLLRGPSRGRAA
jgi:5-methylcytosine-specific restriction endonuclease McrA